MRNLDKLFFAATWAREGHGESIPHALAAAADDASPRQRRVLRRLLRALDRARAAQPGRRP